MTKPFTKLSELFAHLEAGGEATCAEGRVIALIGGFACWSDSTRYVSVTELKGYTWYPYVKPKKYRLKTLAEMKAEGVLVNSNKEFVDPDELGYMSAWALLHFCDKPELTEADLKELPEWAVKEVEE